MFQVRLHGRGGQGVVTSAELLSVAAFLDGHEAQAFPSFGSERMGAPVMAFCRVADVPIRLREPVSRPDAVVVFDPTLLNHVDLFSGLAADGYVVVSSTHPVDTLGLTELEGREPPGRVRTVPGADIARLHTGRALPNAALLGALAALTGVVTIDALVEAVRQRFRAGVAEGNVAAARAGFEFLAPAVEVRHA